MMDELRAMAQGKKPTQLQATLQGLTKDVKTVVGEAKEIAADLKASMERKRPISYRYGLVCHGSIFEKVINTVMPFREKGGDDLDMRLAYRQQLTG